MRLRRCGILVRVDSVPVGGWVGAVRVKMSWCWCGCIDRRHYREIILKFVEIKVGAGKSVVERVEERRIMRAKGQFRDQMREIECFKR